MTQEYVKTRCNNCMAYFDYEENIEKCPYCDTDKFLTDFTEEDINFLKQKGFYE